MTYVEEAVLYTRVSKSKATGRCVAPGNRLSEYGPHIVHSAIVQYLPVIGAIVAKTVSIAFPIERIWDNASTKNEAMESNVRLVLEQLGYNECAEAMSHN
jgi:hypothetical protein